MLSKGFCAFSKARCDDKGDTGIWKRYLWGIFLKGFGWNLVHLD